MIDFDYTAPELLGYRLREVLARPDEPHKIGGVVYVPDCGECENVCELDKPGVAGYHFACSECGLAICASMGIGEIELDTPKSFYWKYNGEYEFERCPRCGRKVVGK